MMELKPKKSKEQEMSAKAKIYTKKITYRKKLYLKFVPNNPKND
jgi:hypothetical protein